VKDCVTRHKRYIKPKGARLFVVGDLTQAQIEAKFAPLLAKWKGKPKSIAKIPAPKSRAGRVFFVDMPGAAQSHIAIGHIGPKRNDPNYFANQMMSAILGGSFSSRLNMNLREDKGYSYGARGNFNYKRHFGLYAAKSAVRSNATQQSLHEILSEIKAIQSGSQPATAKELTREKNGAILGLPAEFATAGQVLNRYRRLVYWGLPMNYYDSLVSNYKNITLEQINAAAKQSLHPEEALIFVVGDGSAKQVIRDGKKDQPRMSEDGKHQLTLRETLAIMASKLSKNGKIVELDVDGNVKK